MARKKRAATAEVFDGPAIVYPVDGAFLHGVPAVPLSTDDATAERLVRTGAFRYEAPEIPEDGGPGEITVTPLDPDGLAALDHYDPPLTSAEAAAAAAERVDPDAETFRAEPEPEGAEPSEPQEV